MKWFSQRNLRRRLAGEQNACVRLLAVPKPSNAYIPELPPANLVDPTSFPFVTRAPECSQACTRCNPTESTLSLYTNLYTKLTERVQRKVVSGKRVCRVSQKICRDE